MSLDARVRCTCIRDGKAEPHPLPDRLVFDENGDPYLSGDPTDDELEAHDKWLTGSCEHGGYLLTVFLGNIGFVRRLRELVTHMQGKPGPQFPTLLKRVIYDGTHTGDWITSEKAKQLLQEVDIILHSRDILSETELEFFTNVRNLCQASIETGSPIAF